MKLALSNYRLLISPSDVVKYDMVSIKNLLWKHIGYYLSMNSPGHLTLAGFEMNVCKEQALIRSLAVAAAEESAITFTINGFGVFESSRTVFLQVQEKERFAQISRNLSKKSVIALLSSKIKGITTTPHLTIGRNLEKKFIPAYNLLYDKYCGATFTATSALLFRQDDSREKYKLIQEFPFLSKPAAQLSLF